MKFTMSRILFSIFILTSGCFEDPELGENTEKMRKCSNEGGIVKVGHHGILCLDATQEYCEQRGLEFNADSHRCYTQHP